MASITIRNLEGSTVTMLVARNIFLSAPHAVT